MPRVLSHIMQSFLHRLRLRRPLPPTSVRFAARAHEGRGSAGALPIFAAVLFAAAPAFAQALPPVGQPVGPLKRGPDGRLVPIERPAAGPASGPVAADGITLPEILAVELPAAGMASIAPTASPLRELLGAAADEPNAVTHDRTAPLPLGGTKVTWTSWAGEPGRSAARTTRSAYVYVLPHGMTAAGLSREPYATGGNQSPKVVQDATGAIHVAWLDRGHGRGAGNRAMYRRGTLDPRTGAPQWEGPPVRASDGFSEGGGSHVAIDASAGAVHLAWQGNGVVFYRRLVRRDGAWAFDPVRAVRFMGESPDQGPAIAAESDERIHLVSPGGRYALSVNAGATWLVDPIPAPPGQRIKLPAMALDGDGNVHIAFTGIVRGPSNPSMRAASRGYWQLRYIRRDAAGRWSGAENVLAGEPAWGDPGDGSDILADWASVAVDESGAVYVGWHGTAATRIYGNDEAHVIRKPAGGAWQKAQKLAPIDRAGDRYFSYAPSLMTVAPGLAIAVTFYEVTPEYAEVFDPAWRALRNGVVDGALTALPRLAGPAIAAGRRDEAIGQWFPVVARRPLRGPDGRAWLGALATAATPNAHGSAYLVVFLRADVSELARRR